MEITKLKLLITITKEVALFVNEDIDDSWSDINPKIPDRSGDSE